MPTLLHGNEVITPSAAEAVVAEKSSRTLAPHVGTDALRIQVTERGVVEELVLPPAAARALLGVLTEMGRGNAVAVASDQAELTTNQAADLLNVSRPHLTKLLADGLIPFRMVGTHHRVRLQDVLAYKKETDAQRLAALDELTALGQELGLYDDPMK